jgi:hypothetical protein
VRQLCSALPNLKDLTDAGIIPLTETACLIGHDGWGDGLLGDYSGSDVMRNDFGLIGESGKTSAGGWPRCTPSATAASHFRSVLPDALSWFRHVVVLTHVSPFREACWHEGNISDDNWLPFFTCKAVGDALLEAMT